MNTDDPKLTAFALDELAEPERSTIARAIADSPQAQRYVEKTRELARFFHVALRLWRIGDRPRDCRSFRLGQLVERERGQFRIISVHGQLVLGSNGRKSFETWAYFWRKVFSAT